MGQCTTDQLQPGMILGSELLTPDGRVMLPAGAELTQSIIRACKIWGVSEADIAGHDPAASREADPQPETGTDMAYKRLAARRFALTNTRHPAVRALARNYLEQARAALTPEQAQALARNYENPAKPAAAPPPCSLEDVLAGEIRLASLPSTFSEISEALKNPRSSAAYVAEIISNDVSLAAKLLRMVNSPFYGFPSAIDTLSRAVTIVGTNQLTSLALGISVISVFRDIPEEHLALRDFWLHSITCGAVARLLATQLGLGNDERFFVAGLMHDIGRLVLLRNQPELALDVFLRAPSAQSSLADLEQRLWGWNHAELGAALLKEWKLPGFLEAMTLYHHSPAKAPNPLEAGVVHVAEFTAHAVGAGSSGSPYVPPLDEAAWDRLGLSSNDLSEIAAQAVRQADQVMAAFFHES